MKTCPLKPAPMQTLMATFKPTEVPSNACPGSSCMFFVPLSAPDGKVIGGNCAVALIAIACVNVEGRLAALQGANSVEADPASKTPN